MSTIVRLQRWMINFCHIHLTFFLYFFVISFFSNCDSLISLDIRRKAATRIVSSGRGSRIEHCRNLRIESVKIEFLLAQERIAPFWQTATLFSRPNENRVHSFRVAVCKRGGAWNAPKRRALPREGYKVEPWIFTARLAGTINLGKCSRVS